MEKTYKGTGLVWDGEKNKTLCHFADGEYTTSDPREQKIIDRALGLTVIVSEEEIKEPNEKPMSKKDILIAECLERGIKHKTRINIEELETLLEA